MPTGSLRISSDNYEACMDILSKIDLLPDEFDGDIYLPTMEEIDLYIKPNMTKCWPFVQKVIDTVMNNDKHRLTDEENEILDVLEGLLEKCVTIVEK